MSMWRTELAGGVLVATRVWTDPRVPLSMRFGILMLASAVVNPHLMIYDVTVLALAAVLMGGYLNTQGGSHWFWQRCYWASVALLLPTARILIIQATPILLGELLLRSARRATTTAGRPELQGMLRGVGRGRT